MADLLTRQFNKIHLQESKEKISNLWAEIQPPLSKHHFGATLTPMMLSDLLANSPCTEYIDCFSKRKYYDQSLTRYHTQPSDILTKQLEPQPVELEFLASLYSGFNGQNMTSAQYFEIENQLKNFPAEALARKIKNSNLNELRKTLFDLDIREDMLSILKRKYFPRKLSQQGITVNEHMRDLDLSAEIQELVKSCLISKSNKVFRSSFRLLFLILRARASAGNFFN